MTKIYVLEGTTGEYSDRYSWLAYGSTKKQDIQQLCDMSNARQVEIEKWLATEEADNMDWQEREKALKDKMKDLDQYYKRDYTGTSYTVIELDMLDENIK